ncbi:glycine-rich RNA-binding protein blt801-like [Camponotus floridanus]|uniref:glycine-rich RNA-binding protein blt801-like n=1 Tax=Camponotus floridanus TaxID=104421 RepID=UPI000DC67580|nr:glycine-rich RNA-binding protein blt801-like [Camponotus floridanus]
MELQTRIDEWRCIITLFRDDNNSAMEKSNTKQLSITQYVRDRELGIRGMRKQRFVRQAEVNMYENGSGTTATEAAATEAGCDRGSGGGGSGDGGQRRPGSSGGGGSGDGGSAAGAAATEAAVAGTAATGAAATEIASGIEEAKEA